MLDYYDKGTELGVTEQLYTARGSQGIGTYDRIEDLFGVNPEDYTELLMLIYEIYETSKVTSSYKLRPIFTTEANPDFLVEENGSAYGLM